MNNHHLARGSIYLIASHIAFFASGYLIHFVLARIVPPTVYGTIGVILSILTVIQIFLLNGIPTASSKYLSEGFNGKQIRNRSLTLQFVYMLLISGFLYTTASIISDLLNDVAYIPYIKFLPIVIAVRSINQLFNGFFNGYREFKRQAIHMAIDSFPRAIFVFLFLYMGYGIYGVLGGYAAASLLGLIYAAIYFKPKITQKLISYRKITNFSFPVIIYSLFFQLVLSLDLFFIKSSNIPEEYVGFYTSAKVICTIFSIFSLTFALTLLPSISKSFSEGDWEQTRSTIRASLRYIMMLFIPLAFIISITSKALLALFFTSEYIKACHSLSILIWGYLFMDIFNVLTAMVNASGKSKIPAFIAGFSFVIAFISNFYLVNRYGMEGGAMATLVSGFICFISGLYFVQRIFKIHFNLKSMARISAASLILPAMAMVIDLEGHYLIAWYIFLFALYLGILFLIREIDNEDIRLVKDLCKIKPFT